MKKNIFPLSLQCWVGVHCGIYKSSYNISNISYLNSHPLLLKKYIFFLQNISSEIKIAQNEMGHPTSPTLSHCSWIEWSSTGCFDCVCVCVSFFGLLIWSSRCIPFCVHEEMTIEVNCSPVAYSTLWEAEAGFKETHQYFDICRRPWQMAGCWVECPMEFKDYQPQVVWSHIV
jgi:hypothetical protein